MKKKSKNDFFGYTRQIANTSPLKHHKYNLIFVILSSEHRPD